MEYTKKEQQALDEVVRKLLEAVKLQEKRVGYLFHPHYEVTSNGK
jgi:hypothetical protein